LNKSEQKTTNMTTKKALILLLALWFIAIISFILLKQNTLTKGTEVVLKSIPVDPRDLFRGDYVVLSYDISTLHMDSLEVKHDKIERGDRVFVKLDTNGPHAKALGIAKTPYQDGLYLSGAVSYKKDNTLRVNYGIESYFVQEGTGKELEKIRKDLDVIVAVDKKGNAVIKYLRHKGQILEY